MTLLQIAAILIVLAGAFGAINYLYLKLPQAIGILIVALAASIGVMVLDWLIPSLGVAKAATGLIIRRRILQGAAGWHAGPAALCRRTACEGRRPAKRKGGGAGDGDAGGGAVDRHRRRRILVDHRHGAVAGADLRRADLAHRSGGGAGGAEADQPAEIAGNPDRRRIAVQRRRRLCGVPDPAWPGLSREGETHAEGVSGAADPVPARGRGRGGAGHGAGLADLPGDAADRRLSRWKCC